MDVLYARSGDSLVLRPMHKGSLQLLVCGNDRVQKNDPSRPRDYEHGKLLEVAKIPMDLCQGCQTLGSPFSLATPLPPDPY